ncbi:MAG: hypothetical protein Q8J68_07860 [Methanolobus sp.]|uniref:hypothetical protein n=1 Tax=Methanolobus sp. TaxID=1874737 RepID=UPI00272FDDF4|nr:hypothetical protein [Methanolobus sp.]MDP2217183.1 hypothetical protein [Methanolobus sp.]
MPKEEKSIFGFGIIDPDKIKEDLRKDLRKTVNESIADGGEVVKRAVSNAILKRVKQARGGE